MSTPFTIQAVHTNSSRPVGGRTANEMEKITTAPYKPSYLRWQWLLSPVLLLIGLLVQLPSQAQTFCAPDATAYYTFERSFNDRSSYDDYFTGGYEVMQNTTNVPSFSTTAKVGAYAASFNGSNQYLSYSSPSGFMRNGGHSISLMFWFKANLPGSGDQVMFEQGDATNGISIRLNNATGQLQARVRTAGTTIDLMGPNITDTDWHHVAFTYSAVTAAPSILYLDGTLADSDTPAQPMGTAGSAGGLGAAQGGNVWNTSSAITQYFNGFIDDFVYSVGSDVINVRGSGASVYSETEIDNYIACVNGFATNKFTCNGGNYNVIYPVVNPSGSDLLEFDYASNSFSTIDGTGTLSYNALGYNQVDNYLYAIRYGTSTEEDPTNRNNTLIRIGANGTIEDLGFVSGLPAGSTSTYNTADVSPTGIMYVTNGSLGTFYRIDLNVKPYTATAVTMPVIGLGDWAYNPNDGFLYSISGFGTVIKINATTGARVIVNPTNGQLPADNYASIWFDQFNNLYAMGARLVRYNITSNAWSTVLNNAPVPASGSSDGAACPVTSADPQITKIIQNQSGNTVTFDITLLNNGPAPVADLNVRDVLPAGLVYQSAQVLNASNVALSPDDYTLTNPVAGANGTVLLKLNDLSVGTANRVVLRLTVRAAAGICNQTISNCAEIISAFGQTTNNGTLGNTADNTTTIPGDVASNNESCAPVSFSLSAAAPTATASATATCTGDLFTINYMGVAVGGTVVWNRMPGNVSGAGNVSEALSNTTAAPISYTYTSSVQNVSGCPSLLVVTVVTVNPRPVVVPSICSQTICSGQTGTISFISSIPGSTIHWSRTPTTPAPSSGTGDISQSFINTGPTSLTYTYQIWADSPAPASCPSSSTITCIIVVTPGLTVAASVVGTSSCIGSPLSLSASVTQAGSFTYTWAGPNGYIGTGANPLVTPTATAANNGSYTVTVTDVSGCSGTATVPVSVSNCCALTASAAQTTSSVCPNDNITLTASTTGAVGTLSYQWNGPSYSTTTNLASVIIPNATISQSGMYTLVVTDNGAANCTKIDSVYISVSPLSASAESNSPQCQGNTLQLNAFGPETGTFTYLWIGPNGFNSTAQNPTIPNATTSATGSYSVVITDTQSGCSGTAVTAVTIATQPDLSIAATPSQTICSGQSTILTVNGSNGAVVTWSNNFGQNGTGTSIDTGVMTNYGTQPITVIYQVTASAGGGTCSDATSVSVVILPVPTIQVIPTAAVVCNLEKTSVTATAYPATAVINWTRTPATNPPTSGSGTGTVSINETLPPANYIYQFTATQGGCTSPAQNVSVTVQQ